MDDYKKDAHMYEFEDQGGILLVINDENGTDMMGYSLDLGNTWCVSFICLQPSS